MYHIGTFGTMGVGLGFAIASALWCQTYEPEKRVLCVEGDSAFGFSGMEVETMVRLVKFTNLRYIYIFTIKTPE